MRGSFALIFLTCFATLASAARLHIQSQTKDLPFCRGSYAINAKNCDKFDFAEVRSHCVDPSNCTTFFDIEKLPNQPIDDRAKRMAQLITSVFENGATFLAFAYVEALGDGRGYTSGYEGFTTGTNDALAVVKEYTSRNPTNILARYLPELTRLSKLKFCDKGRNDTRNLEGYPKAWKTAACSDPVFVGTQLDIGHSMYLRPAVKFAAAYGVRTNLGKAIFYDTIIQHGWQYIEPLINIYRILALTGPRRRNEPELKFLQRFLKTRRQMLCCFPDDVWPVSAGRVSDLQFLLRYWKYNKDLESPVHLRSFNYTVNGDEEITYDSLECPRKPKNWTLPAEIVLPLPDVC